VKIDGGTLSARAEATAEQSADLPPPHTRASRHESMATSPAGLTSALRGIIVVRLCRRRVSTGERSIHKRGQYGLYGRVLSCARVVYEYALVIECGIFTS
jgi:hypothetical protein